MAGSAGAKNLADTEKNTKAAPGNREVYGFIRFYEGKSGTQDTFCPVTVTTLPYHSKEKMCKNDEAQSLRVESLPAGTRIWVFDNSNCDTGDDWALITTLKRANVGNEGPITIWHFEEGSPSSDPTRYAIEYHYQDGNLDGKVSCRIIDVPAG
jgi:hypothetical protein